MSRKHVYLIFIILLLSSFWRLSLFEEFAGKYVPYLGIVTFSVFYYKTRKQKDFYRKYITLYLLGVLVSCIYCRIFHEQGIFPTLVASYSCIGLAGYFLYSKFHLSYFDTIVILKNISILFCLCYIVQWLIYPIPIFATATDEFNITDDVFRMRLPGSICGYILFFMGLNNYLTKKRNKDLLLLVLGATPIIIQGFRSLIFFTLVGAVYMIFTVKKKSTGKISYLIIGLLVLGVSTNIPIVQQKIEEMSERQEKGDTFSNKNYVRNIALVYYWEVVHNQPLEHIFGGGVSKRCKI